MFKNCVIFLPAKYGAPSCPGKGNMYCVLNIIVDAGVGAGAAETEDVEDGVVCAEFIAAASLIKREANKENKAARM